MRNRTGIIALAIAVLIAVPAIAGEEGHKCGQEAQTCLDYMASNLKNRGWAGVEMGMNESGAYAVTRVYDDTPAEAAGVKVGDVLVAIRGIALSEENQAQLAKFEAEMLPGANFDYTLSRKGKSREISLTLTDMPQDVLTAMVGKHLIDQHTTVAVAAK